MIKWAETTSRPDFVLLVLTLILVSFGTVMIYSSSSIMALDRFKDGQFFLKKQLVFFLLGLLVMLVTQKLPYEYWQKLAYPALIFAFLLLVLVLIPHVGIKVGGARRWIRIGPFSFQVAELAKVAIIVYLASYLAKRQHQSLDFIHGVVIPLAPIIPLVVLVLMQPDLGTSIIIVALSLSMLFLGGIRMKYIFSVFLLALPVVAWLMISKSYRLNRLKVFLDPWQDPQNSGFQIIQSLLSFGSGGTFGVGVGDGMQKLFYLPEPHTDFILAVIAEESGFVGVITVIVLFAVFIYRGLMIAFKSKDRFASLLAAGLTMLVGIEAVINIAGVMGLIPLKGLALPFLSYGGSSLIMSMLAVGVLLSISSREV
ncbi:MAG: putative lipid II flippase FtsW [Syntrophales bacterium]|nr:putative lipid II flippase FtsW [Syntrophales bacterium]